MQHSNIVQFPDGEKTVVRKVLVSITEMKEMHGDELMKVLNDYIALLIEAGDKKEFQAAKLRLI